MPIRNPRSSIINLWLDRPNRVGFIVRTTITNDEEIVHVLSRKTGRWIPITAQERDAPDIPRTCLFPINDLPGEPESRPEHSDWPDQDPNAR